MEYVDNRVITIGGFEVDERVQSHEIHPDIMKVVRKTLKVNKTLVGAATDLGVERQRLDSIKNGSCHPKTYIKVLKKLVADEKIPA